MNTALAAPSSPSLTPTRRWLVVAVCASGLFLVGLDTTVVTVALPAIGSGLGVEMRGLEWVVDAYSVVFASLLITSGALADRFGRRRVFTVGLAGFGAASLLCAAATSAQALIAARALQGLAASMLSPVALAIVVSAIPDPRERARAIGVWASVFGLSMAAGPVLGGALLTIFDWRSVFWINGPLVLLALAAVALAVPESRGSRTRPLDLPGQLLLVALVALVVGSLIEGPHAGWDSPLLFAGYAGLAVVGPAFVLVERRHRAPLVELGAFRRPSFAVAVLGAVAVFVAISVTLLFTTFRLQGALGWTPLATGAAVLPLALGATLCAPLSGHLVGRAGPRQPLLLAGASIAAAGVLLSVATSGAGRTWLLLTAYLLFGVGVGFANAPITHTAVSGLPPERAGVAGGITSTARQVGAAVGIAVAGGLVAGHAPADLARAMAPGWLLVTGCGLGLLAMAVTTARR